MGAGAFRLLLAPIRSASQAPGAAQAVHGLVRPVARPARLRVIASGAFGFHPQIAAFDVELRDLLAQPLLVS